MSPNKTNEDSYSKKDLIQYRIQRAYESLDEALLMAESQHYNASISRLVRARLLSRVKKVISCSKWYDRELAHQQM